jgi:hypothetical protein
MYQPQGCCFVADWAMSERLPHWLLADQEEKRGWRRRRAWTRLGLREQQRSRRASLSGAAGSGCDRRFGPDLRESPGLEVVSLHGMTRGR